MPSATITSKGQLPLPKAIRDLLRVGAGDRVEFVVKDDGTVILVRPRSTFASSRACSTERASRPWPSRR